jgi:prolipoprotein diacylglyceryltransferase
MDNIGEFILSAYGIFIGICLIIIIFLIIRRVRIKKTEDFEQRKN